MSGWLPPGCTDKDIDDAAPQDDERPTLWEELADWLDQRIQEDEATTPIEEFQDAYVQQLAREKRRGMLRVLGAEAIKEDSLWFKCWLSVMAHELGWETKPQ